MSWSLFLILGLVNTFVPQSLLDSHILLGFLFAGHGFSLGLGNPIILIDFAEIGEVPLPFNVSLW